MFGSRLKIISMVIFSTRKKFLLVSALLFFVFQLSAQDTTWYSLASGDWDDPTIWTLDPSGALPKNPDNLTPTTAITGNTHRVVILSGRTITVNSDNKINSRITVTGRLELNATTNHDFNEIRGGGKIVLKADNFPAGDSTHFISAGQGEGTVIFDSSGYDLSTPMSFYNLEIDLDNATDSVVLVADYQINGNLTLTQGKLKINNDASTTLLDLTVTGNVSVSANSSIGVGYANAYDGSQNYYNRFHDFTIGGEFESYGVIRLTNQSVPDYTTQTATGAVTIHMTNASDNNFKCYNTTDLYNLHINKGSDATYELTLYVHDKAYFSLFAPNDSLYNRNVSHPEHFKALWIEAGILRLKGEVVIPSLTEGGSDWSIGQNARLILDGENVEVYTTTRLAYSFSGFSHGQPDNIDDGQGNQGISIYGDLEVQNGYFSSYNSAGIMYRDEAAGSVQISGGEIDITQLRLSGSSPSGFYSYVQSGGVFRVRGNGEVSGTNAMFSLNDPDMYFSMTGGQLIADAVSGNTPGAFDIQCSEGNFNVTGGEVIANWGSVSAVNTTADFFNFSVVNGTTVDLDTTLTVAGKLSVDATSTLNAAGHDLYIQDDFLFADGASFIHGSNTTYFYGMYRSTIDIDNVTDFPALSFYNLVLDKRISSRNLVIAYCQGRSEDPADADNTIIQIENDLTIERGQFTIQRYTVSLLGDVSITDGQLVYNQSYPGQLTLNNTADYQTIWGSSLYSPLFGHLEIANADSVILLSDVSLDKLVLSSSILDIQSYQLSIDSAGISSGSAYSNANMIRMNGDYSDKGLQLTVDGSYGNNDQIIEFPIGVGSNYTPIVYSAGANIGAINGTVRISMGLTYHPSVSDPNDVLPYFWRMSASGFTGVSDADIDLVLTYYNTGDFPNGASAAVLRDGQSDWDDSFSSTNGTRPDLDYSGIGFTTGDYTAGKNVAFNKVYTYYTRQDGSWDDKATWSIAGVDGAEVGGTGAQPFPFESYNKIIIAHDVTIPNATTNLDVAGVQILGAHPTTGSQASLDVQSTSGLNFVSVSGGGLLRISYNGTDVPVGDYGEFMDNDTAIFEYYGNAYTIPVTFSEYPNLYITDGIGDKSLGSTSILVNKNLVIDGETLVLNSGNTVIINDSLFIDNAGVLQYPANADPITVTIDKSIDLSGNTAANTIQVAAGGLNSTSHSLYFNNDIILNTNSVIDFYDAGGNVVDLYITGDEATTINDAGSTIDLNRLIIDKSISNLNVNFREAFILNGPTDGSSSEKALYLLNGDLNIRDAGTDFYLTTGGGDFQIPSTASLIVRAGTVRISGANTGIYLDGLMRVGNNSQWLLNEGTNNYIEYSSSGSAEIRIENGILRVGSQIRRNTITDDGILTFAQNHSGSTVIIGETDAPENRRGLLEVLNTGSSFTQVDGANITIVRSQTTPAEAALYLDPDNYSLGVGSSITFGNGSTGGSNMGIRSVITLENVTVSSDETVTEWILPLTLNGDLTIQASSTFDANGLDLTLLGDFYNYGTYTPNGNTTYFSGTGNQRIVGNTNFYNLIKTSTGEMWLAASSAALTISNDLDVQTGVLRDSSNTVTLLGDCNFEGTHIHGSQSGDGMYFNGSDEQTLTGSGTLGKVRVNNSAGVTLPLGSNFTITDTLELTDGVFGIGKNLLTLEVDAKVIGNPGFSTANMIQTNASFTDYGVQKYFPSGAENFLYPIGSGGKYTPVTIDVSANTSSEGYLTVRAADERHPSIQEDSETPEIIDADNVLQYHWVIRSSNITGFVGDAYMVYDPDDALVTAPYDTSSYITARLLNDGSGQWNKYGSTKFDGGNLQCLFNFGLLGPVADDAISGDYTAGVNNAIPNQVPFYESNTDGLWPTTTIWTPNIIGGPSGAMVRINTSDSVTVPANFISSYTTEVQGTVMLNNTFGHRFGDVVGTGVIYTEREVIPAGTYDVFFSSAGGTIEFGGSNDYDVLGDHAVVNNITFSGTGLRRLPSNDLTLNGDFRIDGGSGLNVDNDNNIDIDLGGDLIRIDGAFDAGTDLNNLVSFTSIVNQDIAGVFTRSNELNSMVIDNPNGITISSGVVDISGTLFLTNGTITTSGTDTLRIGVTSSILPAIGSASSYINGPLTKVMSSGDDFVFPLGKSGGLGLVELTNITGITGVDTDVSVEYMFSNPQTDLGATMGSGVNTVSQSEYWSVDVAGGGQSTLTITLDGSSDVANALSNFNDLIIVGWSGTQWEQIGGTYTRTGDATSGSISCNSDIDYSSYQYITLGSDQTITIVTASVVSGDVSICDGETTSFIVTLTGGTGTYNLEYTDGSTTYTENSITSPYIINVSPSTTTTYTLTSIEDDASASGSLVGDTDFIVSVNGIPVPTLISSVNPSCEGVAVFFTASGGNNYEFYEGGVSVQSGTATTYSTSALPTGTTTMDVIVTDANGCSSSLGTVPVDQVVNVNPTPLISGPAVSCELAIDSYSTPLNSGNNYTWSVTGGVLQSANGIDVNSMDIQWNNLLPLGTLSGVFSVSVSESNGTCVGTDTYSVTINRVPQTGPGMHIGNTWSD
jgi:hypothetical protein